MDAFMNDRVQEHWGNRHPWMAPYGVFQCQGEDHWLALAVDSDEAFNALCADMGQPELATDARFADGVSRYRNQDALEPLIEAWTQQHTQRELMERLQAAGVMATMVARQQEMFDDPHLKERGFFIDLDYPDIGVKQYTGPMGRFEVNPLVPVRGRAPLLGEQNREILQGILGMSDEEYQRLVDEQLIGTVYNEDAR
jgi:benzylsuccinate CoA-transferase BbsF subunit